MMSGEPESSIHRLQKELVLRGNPQTRDWWTRYLKGVIPFRGVKMAEIRRVLHIWIESEGIDRLPGQGQKELALALIRQDYAEDKLAGILFLQESLIPSEGFGCSTDLDECALLFDEGYIFDWNICDWFCVKVLGPLVQIQGAACAFAIADWRFAANLWRRRAAGVAFVNLAAEGDRNFQGFTDLLIEVCRVSVQSPERFAQTGVGWVLRELSVAEPQRVMSFIGEHLADFSSEGLRYATAKLPEDFGQKVRAQKKDFRRQGSS